MPEPIRIVFAGTANFAVPALRAIAEGPHELVALYTQPDRAAGRGRRLAPPPAKQAGQVLALSVEQPLSLNTTEAQAKLVDYAPDLMVVVAYGLILPRAVLALPRFGCWNLHASLLPRWRGAAPVQRAILAGDTETAVCLMQMEAGLDTGPVIACKRSAIEPADTSGSVHQRLAIEGAQLLKAALDQLQHDALPEPVAQDETRASYAPKITSAETELDWREPASVLARKVRAFNPAPGARARLSGEMVKVWAAEAMAGAGEPGMVVQADKSALLVGTGDGLFRLCTLQPPGKRAMDARAYLNGRPELHSRAQS